MSMVANTPYKCSISLKNTVTVASNRPAPMVNIKSRKIGIMAYRMYMVKAALVTIITPKSTTNESRNVTKLERITPRLYMYLGT